jgi:hypothetical protein
MAVAHTGDRNETRRKKATNSAGVLENRHFIMTSSYKSVSRSGVPAIPSPLMLKHKRAERRHTTWTKARKAQQAHLSMVHWDGALDCVCERSVWYFAKRKSVGHHRHCEMCHPRYRNGHTRSRAKRFMNVSGLLPTNKQLKVFYE